MRRSEGQPSSDNGLALGLLIAACAVFVFLRFLGVGKYPLDGDEIFSFLTARADWSTFTRELVRDAIHPPLFYLLLRGWMWLGGSTPESARFLPMLFGMLCVVPLVLLAREWRQPAGVTAFAVLMLALNPAAILYAQHVRMYSLLMLLALLSLWLLARLLESGSTYTLAALTAVNLLMVYTQYYGWVAVALEGLAVLLWRRDLRWRFLAATTLVGALFAPWAYLAAGSLRQKGGLSQNLGWVPEAGWKDFTWFFAEWFSLTDLPYGGNIAMGVLALLVLVLARWRDRRAWLLLLFALLPAAIAFAAARMLPQSIWGQRHLLMTGAPLYLLCGMAIWRLPRAWMRGALALLVCVWAAAGWVSDVRKPDAKLRWDALIAEAFQWEASGDAPIPVYVLDGYVPYPLEFHLESIQGPGRPSSDGWPGSAVRAAARVDLRETGVDDVHGRGWVAYSRSVYEPEPAWRETLHNRGCQTGEPVSIRDRYREVTLLPVTCGL